MPCLSRTSKLASCTRHGTQPRSASRYVIYFIYLPCKSAAVQDPFCLAPLPASGAIPQGEELHSFFHRKVLRIAENKVLKLGSDLSPGEANMMRFVNDHIPAVPCPFVYSIHEYQDRAAPTIGIMMAHAPGRTLEGIWKTASEADKTAYIAQLRDIILRLRQHTAPFIGRAGHQPCIDPGGFGDVQYDMGPFDDEKLFNQYRLDQLRHKRGDAVAERAAGLQKSGHKFVLTHGDLSDRNVMVENGRITGILDWEFSGWYPEYWEYCQSQLSPSHDPYWREVLAQVLDPYDDMVALEKVILGIE
jgi:hypothetical protein